MHKKRVSIAENKSGRNSPVSGIPPDLSPMTKPAQKILKKTSTFIN